MRYYFDSHDFISIVDDVGVELDSLVDARVHCALLMGAMLTDAPQKMWDSAEWSVTVRDSHGLVQCRISTRASDFEGLALSSANQVID